MEYAENAPATNSRCSCLRHSIQERTNAVRTEPDAGGPPSITMSAIERHAGALYWRVIRFEGHIEANNTRMQLVPCPAMVG
jgi:hypothetical protein